MNEVLEIIKQLFTRYIDVTLAILIVFSGYWARKYICNILPSWKMAHKMLIWSSLVTAVYYFAIRKAGPLLPGEGIKYVITYFFSTSFYELIFDPLEQAITGLIKRISSLLNKSNDPAA